MDDPLRRGEKQFKARDKAIYLLKKESGLSLKEIGKRVGVSLGAVGQIWVSAKKRLAEDDGFARRVAKYIL